MSRPRRRVGAKARFACTSRLYLAESYGEAQFQCVLAHAEMQEAFFGRNYAVFENNIDTEEQAEKKKQAKSGKEGKGSESDEPTPLLLGNLVYGYLRWSC